MCPAEKNASKKVYILKYFYRIVHYQIELNVQKIQCIGSVSERQVETGDEVRVC